MIPEQPGVEKVPGRSNRTTPAFRAFYCLFFLAKGYLTGRAAICDGIT